LRTLPEGAGRLSSYLGLWLSLYIKLLSGEVDISPCREVPVEIFVSLVEAAGLVVSPRAGSLLASVEAIRVDGGDDGDVCGVDQLCDRVNTGVVTMSE